jgi:hypothetical protein
MKPISKMSRLELAALICSHLKEKGLEVILTGGSCVSIYTNNKYESWDLDFIETQNISRKELAEFLTELGFYEENRYFKNSETEIFIEFPPGPLAIGSEPVFNVITIKAATGELQIISPTDCVKDRLAAYYFWNDLQCLEQAVMVSESQEINLEEIKRWSVKEGEEKKFDIFLSKTHKHN